MRLSTRNNVDLPQPDGPMKAVTLFSYSDRLIDFSALESP